VDSLLFCFWELIKTEILYINDTIQDIDFVSMMENTAKPGIYNGAFEKAI
jgi:hypothetical protein